MGGVDPSPRQYAAWIGVFQQVNGQVAGLIGGYHQFESLTILQTVTSIGLSAGCRVRNIEIKLMMEVGKCGVSSC